MIREDCIYFYRRKQNFLELASCALKDKKYKKEFFIKYDSYILSHGCDSCTDFKNIEDVKKELEVINANTPKE